MKRYEVSKCLLCNRRLHEAANWKTLFSNQFPKTVCLHCEEKFEPCDANVNDKSLTSLYKYNDQMKDYVHRYKFMHDVLLAKVFRHQIQQHLAKKKAIIVPIPMHPEKLKERTFAHVDELLKEANVPFEHYLKKITSDTQGGKTREQRLNAPQIFTLKENVEPGNKEFILVDDIYTTGTTIKQAKEILLDAGAKSVAAFTLIRR